MSFVALRDGERVVAGRNVAVHVRGRNREAVARAITECNRQVRALSIFGLFALPSAIEYGTALSDGTYFGWVCGQTWRAPGEEYTVAQLRQGIASVIPPGSGTLTITVQEIAGELALDAIAATDPRGGGVAGSIASGAGKVGDAVSGTLGAVADTTVAASDAARGLADLASGAGIGAQGVGAFLGQMPIVAFGVVAAALAFVVWVKIK